MKKKQAGYTLVELMVVVGIIGILVAITAIASKNWMDRYNVERQMKDMYSDLMKAKIAAMTMNRFQCVTFSSTGYTIREDRDPWPNGDGDCDDAGDSIWVNKSLPSNYAITWTGSTPMRFNTRGFTPVGEVGTAYVTINYDADYECVAIDDARINIGTWNGSCAHK